MTEYSKADIVEPQFDRATMVLLVKDLLSDKIYGAMKMVYYYHNFGHCPPSCLLFKIQLKSPGLSIPHSNTLRLRYEPNRLMLSIGFDD
jgi:hypothetical protein